MRLSMLGNLDFLKFTANQAERSTSLTTNSATVLQLGATIGIGVMSHEVVEVVDDLVVILLFLVPFELHQPIGNLGRRFLSRHVPTPCQSLKLIARVRRQQPLLRLNRYESISYSIPKETV